jgi:hypothetical protein
VVRSYDNDLPACLSPSIRVRSCATTRRSTSPDTSSRLGAIESISSMNMMSGRSSRPARRSLSACLSTRHSICYITSGPLIVTKFAPDSLATAFARRVFPQPGRTVSRTPFGGLFRGLEEHRVLHRKL